MSDVPASGRHIYAHRDLRSAARPSPSGGVLCRPCRASSVRNRQTPRRERPRSWFRLRLRDQIGVAHALVPAVSVGAPEWPMNASKNRCESDGMCGDFMDRFSAITYDRMARCSAPSRRRWPAPAATTFRVLCRALTAPARRAVRWHLRDGRRCEWLTLTRDFQQA